MAAFSYLQQPANPNLGLVSGATPPPQPPATQRFAPGTRPGFTPLASYHAPAGRPQYVQATHYGSPHPAYQPPPPAPVARVAQAMTQRALPAYNPGVPIAAQTYTPPGHR